MSRRDPQKPKPAVVRVGSVEVKIYADTNRGYSRFTVVYYDASGRRKREFFSSLQEAKTAAQLAAANISRGELETLKLSNQDRTEYVHAVNLLEPFSCGIGIAVAEYADARRILRDSASLVEAARYYIRHHPAELPRKTTSEILQELMACKTADGMSLRYLSDLQSRLGKFTSHFSGLISEITAKEIQEWLTSLELAPRGRNNFRAIIVLFFNFAKQQGYLPKNQPTEADSLSKAKSAETGIGIFAPEDIALLLERADESLVPYLAIGSFAGLRTAEIQRLDWREVKLDQQFIEITAGKAKTAQRRLVPITPNLHAWLRPYAKHAGPVCRLSTVNQKASDFARGLKVEWPHNGMRHSYASYRLASCKNAAEVAHEMGNSPRMVFQHYRELVTPKDAERWWKIHPQEEANVIDIAMSS